MVILTLGAFWLPGDISDCHNLGWGVRETLLNFQVSIPGNLAHSCYAILDKLLNNSDSRGDQPREARDVADDFTLHRRTPQYRFWPQMSIAPRSKNPEVAAK